MEWLTNEMIFYIGIGIAVCSVLSSVIYFLLSQIRWIRMKVQLDEEYGKKYKQVGQR